MPQILVKTTDFQKPADFKNRRFSESAKPQIFHVKRKVTPIFLISWNFEYFWLKRQLWCHCSSLYSTLGWLYYICIGESRGHHRRALPLSVQILSFLHTNFPRCHRIRPWPPLPGRRPPPSGNPGSATDLSQKWKRFQFRLCSGLAALDRDLVVQKAKLLSICMVALLLPLDRNLGTTVLRVFDEKNLYSQCLTVY